MSLRNYLKGRKIHKERSQPEHRASLGFLEKKKDYKLRAIDSNKKKDKLQALQREAETKNPDEFYFKMLNSKVVNGVHTENPTPLKPEEEKRMVEEDVRYLDFHIHMARKKLERRNLGEFKIGKAKGKHIKFDDDGNAIEVKKEDSSESESETERENPAVRKMKKLIKTRNSLRMKSLDMMEGRKEKIVVEEDEFGDAVKSVYKFEKVRLR